MSNQTILKVELHGNNLLRKLKEQDRNLLTPHLKEIRSERGMVIFEAGDNVTYTYFPCDQTLVSFLVQLDNGKGVETALVGREGAVGGIVSQGRLPAYCSAVVQYPGLLLRIESALLEEAKTKSVTLRHLFARYSDCLLAQVFQSVACNAIHTIEQRTAKWLLAAIDRTGDHVLPLSQDQLASMLGVGRSDVSRVIGTLKSKEIIETRRGRLLIRSMSGLKTISCECRELVDHHFETVLAGVYPHDAA